MLELVRPKSGGPFRVGLLLLVSLKRLSNGSTQLLDIMLLSTNCLNCFVVFQPMFGSFSTSHVSSAVLRPKTICWPLAYLDPAVTAKHRSSAGASGAYIAGAVGGAPFAPRLRLNLGIQQTQQVGYDHGYKGTNPSITTSYNHGHITHLLSRLNTQVVPVRAYA